MYSFETQVIPASYTVCFLIIFWYYDAWNWIDLYVCVLIQVPYLLSLSYSHLYMDPFLGNEAPSDADIANEDKGGNVMEVGFDTCGGD